MNFHHFQNPVCLEWAAHFHATAREGQCVTRKLVIATMDAMMVIAMVIFGEVNGADQDVK